MKNQEQIQQEIEDLKADVELLTLQYEEYKKGKRDNALHFTFNRIKTSSKMLNRLFGFTHSVPESMRTIPFNDGRLITYSDER